MTAGWGVSLAENTRPLLSPRHRATLEHPAIGSERRGAPFHTLYGILYAAHGHYTVMRAPNLCCGHFRRKRASEIVLFSSFFETVWTPRLHPESVDPFAGGRSDRGRGMEVEINVPSFVLLLIGLGWPTQNYSVFSRRRSCLRSREYYA